MINRITMETVACLRSKCHLKQNLIPSWPWSFRHTSCISDFRCKTKYTIKKCCRTSGPAYLAVLPVLVIFCQLGPTNFKKSAFIGADRYFFKNVEIQNVIFSILGNLSWDWPLYFLFCNAKFINLLALNTKQTINQFKCVGIKHQPINQYKFVNILFLFIYVYLFYVAGV